MSKPSIILLGSKPGSLVALEFVLKRGWDVRAVVVSKEDPHPWLRTTLRIEAERAGVPVYTQATLPRDISADLVVSYMYRNRVKHDTLALARSAALNFHAGPLPEFGGWAFYSIAILENSSSYGCTCHHMDEGFDTGPLCAVRRFSIDPAIETALSLEQKAQIEMIDLFVEICLRVERGETLPCMKQDANKLRYMKYDEFVRLKQIPEDADEETIQRYARAFWYPPYEGAYLLHKGMKVEVAPDLVKMELATKLHDDDIAQLQRSADAAQRKFD